jgi:hypothetical protein
MPKVTRPHLKTKKRKMSPEEIQEVEAERQRRNKMSAEEWRIQMRKNRRKRLR